MDIETVQKLTDIGRRLDTQELPEKSSDLISPFLALPALRAFWPMSAVDYTNPQALDIGGGSYHLTNNNVATFGYDPNQVLVPCVFLDGVNQYLSRADGGAANWADVTGTEAFIENTIVGARGLTFGGWFLNDTHDTVGDLDGLIAKTTYAGNQVSYLLGHNVIGTYNFASSSLGTIADITSVGSQFISLGIWHFAVGRFDPSTTKAIFVDGVKNSIATAHASIFDSTAPLTIGAYNAGANNFMDGRASLCFLCAAALSDATISSLFQQSRAAFGV